MKWLPSEHNSLCPSLVPHSISSDRFWLAGFSWWPRLQTLRTTSPAATFVHRLSYPITHSFIHPHQQGQTGLGQQRRSRLSDGWMDGWKCSSSASQGSHTTTSIPTVVYLRSDEKERHLPHCTKLKVNIHHWLCYFQTSLQKNPPDIDYNSKTTDDAHSRRAANGTRVVAAKLNQRTSRISLPYSANTPEQRCCRYPRIGNRHCCSFSLKAVVFC